MAKKTKSNAASRSARSPSTEFIDGTISLATAADLKAAASLPPSNRKKAINEVSTTIAAFYATPTVKEKLLALQPQLATFKGCGDLASVIALAEEATSLEPVYVRLRELANRVGQQIIENNKVIRPADTALAAAARNAEKGTAAQKGLAPIAKLREGTISRTKAVRTKNKKAKAKGAGKGP